MGRVGVATARARRGDVVLVAGGVYATKPRPAVIVQEDLFAHTNSVTVCPLTTTEVDAPLLRLAVPADENSGLDIPSFVMVDKVTTVRRSNLGDRLGSLKDTQMVELERRLMVFLGLAR